MSRTNEVDEIECETTKPVLVGHIQVSYLASHDLFQNLVKPSPFEVETTSDVGDDCAMVSELIDESGRLICEELALVSCRDSCIDDVSSLGLVRFDGLCCNCFDDTGDIISSEFVWSSLNESDFALAAPPSECFMAHPENLARFAGGDEFG